MEDPQNSLCLYELCLLIFTILKFYIDEFVEYLLNYVKITVLNPLAINIFTKKSLLTNK